MNTLITIGVIAFVLIAYILHDTFSFGKSVMPNELKWFM
jgi:cytochrome bd-type quinol oxidase subunit 2